jgi:hypothetical protein
MPNTRHTLVFLHGVRRWTETYINLGGASPGVSSEKDVSTRLAKNRSTLLGVGPAIIAVRQWLPGAVRDTFIWTNPDSNDGKWINPTGGALVGGSGRNADFSDTALRVRYDCGANHFAIRYLSGCPDDVFTGPDNYDLTAFIGGITTWRKWKSYLMDNGWGINVRSAPQNIAHKAITAVGNDAQGFLQITADPSITSVGGHATIHGGTFVPAFDVSGTYKVIGIAGGVLTLDRMVVLPPGAVYKGGANYTNPDMFDNEIEDVTALGVSERKRGTRGLFSPRGRRSTHKSHR